MKTIYVNKFDNGMANDLRDPTEGLCATCQHFDAFTNRYKLTPNLTAEVGDSSASSHLIKNFAFTGSIILGLGSNTGGTLLSLFHRTSFTDALWTEVTMNITAGGGDPASDTFVPFFTYYPTTGKVYTVVSGQYIVSVSVPGYSGNSEHDFGSAVMTSVSNGLVHSKDDILYFGYNNIIASNNAGSWNYTALTLPANSVITSICEYGNYLAIGCQVTGTIKSIVYLWDRNSSLTTLSERIDWGVGNLYMLETISGYLVGVSFTGETTPNVTVQRSYVIFRYYNGTGQAINIQAFTGFSQSPAISATIYKTKAYERVYFPATIPIDTVGYSGVWAIAKTSAGFGITMEYAYLNNVSQGVKYGLMKIGDYMFMSHYDNSTFYLDKTNDSATYTTTSIYESTINPQMPSADRPQLKQLISFGATYEALPTAGQVVGKVRIDGKNKAGTLDGWDTVFTETTDGTTYTEPWTQDASSASFTKGKDFEFRLESTGGAEITGLVYKYDNIASNI